MSTPEPRTLVIAEIGVNHNGDVELAKKLVDAAISSGADVAKFQVFDADRLATVDAPSAEYQVKNTGGNQGQWQMLRDLQLTESEFHDITNYCEANGIEFMASGFSLEDIDIISGLGVRRFKIPSGEITNLPYLRAIASHRLPIILSTGMADGSEVEQAVVALEQAGCPRDNVTVLHCTTDYPTSTEDVNLRAMLTLRDALGVKVGYSDHTQGVLVAPVAVGMGAEVIEKHLTLDRNLPGPDHLASSEPGDFALMVDTIKAVERLLGSGQKTPTKAETANRLIARKSLVAAKTIVAGEVFTAENLTAKRPGSGISPMMWDAVIGTTASRTFAKDEPIEI